MKMIHTRNERGAPWHWAKVYSDLPNAKTKTLCGHEVRMWWARREIDDEPKGEIRCLRCLDLL